jgi:hypothetical protein
MNDQAEKRRRISGRSVNPCSTNVPSTTANALSTIKSRSGKEVGRESAVARVTKPRIPHHETTTAWEFPVAIFLPRLAAKKAFARMYSITQAKRTTTTPTNTMAAKPNASEISDG